KLILLEPVEAVDQPAGPGSQLRVDRGVFDRGFHALPDSSMTFDLPAKRLALRPAPFRDAFELVRIGIRPGRPTRRGRARDGGSHSSAQGELPQWFPLCSGLFPIAPGRIGA